MANRRAQRPDALTADAADESAIPGRRAVLEALRARRPIRKILIAHTAHGGGVREIVHEAKAQGIVVQSVDPRRLDEVVSGGPHQGIVAFTAARPSASVEDILANARAKDEPPLVLMLDGVEDPSNLGALIRTAESAGVHGVIIPKHRAAGITPAVVRSSAGAVEHLPVAVVTNLVQTIEELKRLGLWVVGAAPDAKDVYHLVRLAPPLAVVMGGEERGLGRLVREHCDLLVRLPMRGKVASLNVSVAAGVLLFEINRQTTTAQFP